MEGSFSYVAAYLSTLAALYPALVAAVGTAWELVSVEYVAAHLVLGESFALGGFLRQFEGPVEDIVFALFDGGDAIGLFVARAIGHNHHSVILWMFHSLCSFLVYIIGCYKFFRFIFRLLHLLQLAHHVGQAAVG
jgi:hypothetical protein